MITHSIFSLLTAATLAVAASLAAFAPPPLQTFGDDLAFLKTHTRVVLLADTRTGARVEGGQSFGWVNRALLAAHVADPRFNAYGGEDRFWLGPEGGQFGLYFAKGDPYDLAHWKVPAALDTEPYPVEAQAALRVSFTKRMAITNHAGTRFDLELHRTVRLLPAAEAA